MNKLTITLSHVTKHYPVTFYNGESPIANVLSHANRHTIITTVGSL